MLCIDRYDGHVLGLSALTLVNKSHSLSGIAVCFARAVNGTPKIAALLLAAGVSWKLGLVATAIGATIDDILDPDIPGKLTP